MVLKETADCALNTVRNADSVARYGGEEFAIALPETDLNGAVILAERLRQKVAELPFSVNGEIFNVTISLGISTLEPGTNVKEKAILINAADKALYKSKNKGRNKTSFVNPESNV